MIVIDGSPAERVANFVRRLDDAAAHDERASRRVQNAPRQVGMSKLTHIYTTERGSSLPRWLSAEPASDSGLHGNAITWAGNLCP
jgi:hypothetical protein